MTGVVLIGAAGPVLAGVIVWLCTRGYYRAAYGDRYERGYADGRATQIRAYQDARVPLSAWRETAVLTGGRELPPSYDPYDGDQGRKVLGSWYPLAAGPPRYAELSPEALDSGPQTSEWARDLITGIEQWNAKHLASGDAPWPG